MNYAHPLKKPTALVAIGIYLCLSGRVALETGEHLLKHRRAAGHHSKQRVSFACNWICDAITPLRTLVFSFDHVLQRFPEALPEDVQKTYLPVITFDHPGRAPPLPFKSSLLV